MLERRYTMLPPPLTRAEEEERERDTSPTIPAPPLEDPWDLEDEDSWAHM